MAVVNITKIGILSLKSDEGKIMDALYDFGGIQVIQKDDASADQPADLDKLSSLEYRLAQVKFALSFISAHKEEKKVGLLEKMRKLGDSGIKINESDIKKVLQEFDYMEIVKQVEELEAQLNSIGLKVSQYKNEIAELEPWKSLSSVYRSAEQDRVQAKLGVFSFDNYADCLEKVKTEGVNLAIEKVSEGENEVRVAVVYLRDDSAKVSDILNEFSFKEVILPDYSDAPAKLIADRKKAIAELQAEKKDLSKAAAYLSLYDEKLKIIFDYLTWERDKLAARLSAGESRSAFYLQGWMDKDRVADLKKKLKQISSYVYLTELEPDEGEEPPVALKNKSFISPFETVTNIYGAPKPDELDPTPYLAPFFILFFGICLSDAGYGLLLALLSWAAIKIMKIPRAKQGMFRLLIYAGVVTFIVGVLFGGYFGIVLDDLPAGTVRDFLLSLRVIDPVKNPLTMLVFSLILGGMQIVAGLLINLYYRLQRKDWGKAFDTGAWLFFIFGIVVWLVAGQVLNSSGLAAAGKYWIYAGIVILVLTQGRSTKNLFLKIPMGVLSLYDIVGYFSDIMSYSRLLALGLSTGIIAMVVNLVAFLFKDMIPYIGWLVAIVILVGGHLFNLAINALGSFIHSGRLQYVEFFPKFMEGGGERFKPLVKTAKYIDLYNKD